VIETDDVVLIADRGRSETIRSLVAALKAAGRSEACAHAEDQRPWGSFRVLHEAPGFKVKEIVGRFGWCLGHLGLGAVGLAHVGPLPAGGAAELLARPALARHERLGALGALGALARLEAVIIGCPGAIGRW